MNLDKIEKDIENHDLIYKSLIINLENSIPKIVDNLLEDLKEDITNHLKQKIEIKKKKWGDLNKIIKNKLKELKIETNDSILLELRNTIDLGKHILEVLSTNFQLQTNLELSYTAQDIKRILRQQPKISINPKYKDNFVLDKSKLFIDKGEILKFKDISEEINEFECELIDKTYDCGQFNVVLLKKFKNKNFDSQINELKSLSKNILKTNALSVDLSSVKALSDFNFKRLIKILMDPNFHHLRYFYLNLEGCFKLSDEALNEAMYMLLYFKSLKKLEFNFATCSSISQSFLENFFHILKNLNELEFLDLKLEQSSFSDVKVSELAISNLCNSLERMLDLKELALDFSNCTKIEEHSAKKLCSFMKKLDKLGVSRLNFCNCQNITDSTVKALMDIESCPFLYNFELRLNDCPLLTNDALDNIGFLLRKLNQLTSLCLAFGNSVSVTDSGYLRISKSISCLTLLKELHLIYNKASITDYGFQELIFGISTLPSLAKLSFDLENSKLSLDPEIIQFSWFEKLGKLNEISMNFYGSELIQGIGFIKMATSIASNDYLKKVKFNVKGCSRLKVSDIIKALIVLNTIELDTLDFSSSLNTSVKLVNAKGLNINLSQNDSLQEPDVKELSQCLRNLSPLVDLNVSFNGCSCLNDSVLNSFSVGLSGLTFLKHLSLDFSNCSNLSDNGLRDLYISLRLMELLTSMSLYFASCSSISDIALANLAFCLLKFRSLSKFALNISDCPLITPIGYEEVSNMISKLISLRHLSLNIGGMLQKPALTDTSLMSICSTIRDLSNLTHLDLNLKLNQKVTDLGFKEISETLKYLTQLQHLTLDFSLCSNIKDFVIAVLAEGILDLQKLSTISLAMVQCTNISDISIISLASSIEKLGSIHSIYFIFDDCNKITDLGINELYGFVKKAEKITDIHLSFEGCYSLTEKAHSQLNDLKASIKNF